MNLSSKIFRSFGVLKTLTRHAAIHQRSKLSVLPREHLDSLKTKLLGSCALMTPKDWSETRETLLSNYKNINENNVDVLLLSLFQEADHLSMAKNYVKYLKSIGVEPNSATLGRLLRIYNAAYHKNKSLSPNEENEILEIYKALKQKHEVFDASTCENLIYGLTATKYWEEANDYINMIKLTATPSVNAYSQLASKAFSMENMTMGWNILDDMVKNHRLPKCEIMISYLDTIFKDSLNFLENLEKLFEFLQKNDLIISKKVCDHIKNLCSLHPSNTNVEETSLTREGKCQKCSKQMRKLNLTRAEFNRLRDAFLNKVLVGRDVFQKSSPKELDKFISFVLKNPPFDCVIDGLNVAYSSGNQNSSILARLLASVVKYFVDKNENVLVLGRQHMKRWPKDTMSYVYKNAKVFLTENLTHDDPFLLYATLHSGESSNFFSRDLMRSHAFLLGDELKPLFRRWQQMHQYSLVTQKENGKILVKEPVKHLICAHKVGKTWHLPYKDEYMTNPPETFEVPAQWLCVQIKS